ncbi:MAG: hypothetical protein P4L92_02715 [Rudaea sp.]|nr:hypothetical protein [Rudaea sp.]
MQILRTIIFLIIVGTSANAFAFAKLIAAHRLLAAVAVSQASGAPDINQHGLTGSWYEDATAGQGFEIETFPDLFAPGTGFIFVSWFTFDYVTIGGADHQRWYTLSGSTTSGASTAQLAIAQNTGGNFDAPPATAGVQVGTATLSFSSCDQATLDYAFSDGSGRHGIIPITRITQNVTCTTSGAPPVDADFALSGNWYAEEQAGQGFTVEINPLSKFAFVAWYTYAPNGAALGAGGQRWYTLGAAYVPGSRSVALPIAETTAGLFDTPTTPAPSSKAVGSATLEFQSCTSATLSFKFTSGSSAGAAGSIALSRVASPSIPPGCSSGASAAEGYWTGSASNETFRDIILDDGTFYLIYSTGGIASDVVQGTSHAENGTITSSNAVDYPIASKGETNDVGILASVSGNYVQKSSLQLAVKRRSATGSQSATYDARYEQPASAAAVAGNYQGYSGHAGGRLATTFSVDASGNVGGSNAACGYSGKITPHKSTNVFDFTIRAVSGQCIYGVGPISGITHYDDATRQFYGFAAFSDRTDQFYLIGAKQ